jgi:hypothetical protein
MKMIADKEFPYQGVRYKVGDELEVKDRLVRLFTKIGRAHVAGDLDTGEMTYSTRMMSAAVNVASAVVRKRGRPRKTQ